MSGTERNAKPNRRYFLGLIGASAALLTAIGYARPSGQWRFLTAADAKTLAALCDQIIPPDGDPGAVELSVVHFIDIQLAGSLKKFRKVYTRGLLELNEYAGSRFGSNFAKLDRARQLECLDRIDSEMPDGNVLHDFFRMAVAHTMMGYYGDPRHGGNRGRRSWEMLKLPYPQVPGTFHGKSRGTETQSKG